VPPKLAERSILSNPLMYDDIPEAQCNNVEVTLAGCRKVSPHAK
jgi:hypothetical protein